MGEPQAWEVLGSAYLSRKPWLTLRQDRVRLPGGAVIDEYFVLEYPAWVNVVAVTSEGRVVLVRQYRHGLGRVGVELPAGVIDPGDPSPESAARRELLEETGYGGGAWGPLCVASANRPPALATGPPGLRQQAVQPVVDLLVPPRGGDEGVEVRGGELVGVVAPGVLQRVGQDRRWGIPQHLSAIQADRLIGRGTRLTFLE